MSAAIAVRHPVPCLHRSPRARSSRFRHLEGVTAVEIADLPDTPREIASRGDVMLVESGGSAWTRARDVRRGRPLDFAGLKSILEGTAAPAPKGGGGQGCLDGYLVRSPLCWYVKGDAGRGGDGAAGSAPEQAVAAASDRVRAFLEDRVRLHAGEVYLRYERLLLAAPLHVGFTTEFPVFPRTASGISVHRNTAGYVGLEHGGAWWAIHRAIRTDLLGDEDALWFANCLPEQALRALGRPGLETALREAERAEASELRGILSPLAQLGGTLSVDGERLLPALRTVHDAAERICRLAGAAATRGRQLVHAEDARNFRHAADTLARHAIPRLVARFAPPGEDIESLGLLIP